RDRRGQTDLQPHALTCDNREQPVDTRKGGERPVGDNVGDAEPPQEIAATGLRRDLGCLAQPVLPGHRPMPGGRNQAEGRTHSVSRAKGTNRSKAPDATNPSAVCRSGAKYRSCFSAGTRARISASISSRGGEVRNGRWN